MPDIDHIINQTLYIAGACSIESRDHIFKVAEQVKKAGATMLRGGAFKPRTSPHSFQGLGKEALTYLIEAGKAYDLPTASEIMDPRDLDLFEDIDMLQVGARNMQNFELLKELGKTDKYILLKRGMGATIDELIAASEYISSQGNEKIILCERGIRSFEQATRYTLDISAVPVLKERTNYKVIVDPSHAAGLAKYVPSLALAAMGAGADGLLIEAHPKPEEAWTDQSQQITFETLKDIIHKSKQILAILDEK